MKEENKEKLNKELDGYAELLLNPALIPDEATARSAHEAHRHTELVDWNILKAIVAALKPSKLPSPNPKEELSDCCGAKIITGARTFDNFNGTICSSCGGACLDKIPEINPSPTPQEGWEIGIMSLKPLHDLERIGAVKEIEQIKDFVRTEIVRREKEAIKIINGVAKEAHKEGYEKGLAEWYKTDWPQKEGEKIRKDTLTEAIKIVEDADIPDYKIWVTARRIILNKIEALNSLRDE